MQREGRSQRYMIKALNNDGVASPSGRSEWNPMMMSRLLKTMSADDMRKKLWPE
jgi:hypothetical protein